MGIKGVYYWLEKLGGVLKVLRKTHAKKDADVAEKFKMELARHLDGLNIPSGKCLIRFLGFRLCKLYEVQKKLQNIGTLKGKL